MRTSLIAGNFKMFKTVAETVSYVNELRVLIKDVRGVDVAIAPPFPAVAAAAAAASGSAIAVGAQNMHWEREGAFTGEVSATMIREAGARYVIIGHSERRTLFGETNDGVNKKTQAALAAGLTPIVCIGETLDQRDRNETLAVLDRQLKEGLDRITGEQLSGIVLAYEPVWAIGTGRNATPAQAGEAHFHIRQRLKQWFGLDASEHCRVVYGGSVKPDNIAKLIAEPDVDGALVGGASLDPKSFFAIIQGASRSK
ncbi:MAG TPA: triose-phosphate isomerase [Vicinamibacterales bacterium]|nr:triose-phosphate isomerase [Vicinamibacterales bacterium]